MAIDNIEVTETPLSSCNTVISSYPYTEDFEYSGSLTWIENDEDDLNWTHNSNSTPSSNTGPSSASEGSYYYYIESSFPNYGGKTAILESPCFDMSVLSEAYFNFDYHMYGDTMGSLRLEMSTDGNHWQELWSQSGNRGNQWLSESIPISLPSLQGKDVKFRFVGTTGGSYTSDMAIDNIYLSERACREYFLDTGSYYNNYFNGEYWSRTYYPNNSGEKVEVFFDYVELEQNYDFLYVYDGPSTASHHSHTFSGSYTNRQIISSHPSGALTFKFTSDSSVTMRGWKATINKCVTNTARYSEKETTNSNNGEPEDNEASVSDWHVTLFPNPVGASLEIKMHGDKASGATSVAIISVLGKVVGTYTFKALQQSMDVDVSKLSAGIYYVKISNSNGEIIKKIIKE